MPDQLTIHIDGGSRGNPGPAAAGVVIAEGESDKPLHEAGYVLGEATNNVAEYTALIRAVELADGLGGKELSIHSDSELLVKQITGQYRVKNEALAELLEEAQVKLIRFDAWHIKHVKREQNKRADALVNMALDAGEDVIVTGEGATGAPPPKAKGTKGRGKAQDTATPINASTISVHFSKKPGMACPVRNMPRRFTLNACTPDGMCVFAAQAVFDEQVTLWKEIDRDRAQTTCPRCEVPIEIERR